MTFDVEPSLMKRQSAPFDGFPSIVEMLQGFREKLQLRLTTRQVPSGLRGCGRPIGRIRIDGIFIEDLMKSSGIAEGDLQEFEDFAEINLCT